MAGHNAEVLDIQPKVQGNQMIQFPDLKKKAINSRRFLENVKNDIFAVHPRSKERCYSDEILSQFKNILLYEIFLKERSIFLQKQDIRDIQSPQNREGFDILISDSTGDINRKTDNLERDMKVLSQYKAALRYIGFKTYGICHSSRQLISIEELLSQPGRKTTVQVKKAMSA